MSSSPMKITTDIWEEELKYKCPLMSCAAPPGQLCRSKSVFIHFERFQLAEQNQNDNVRNIHQLRLPGLQA